MNKEDFKTSVFFCEESAVEVLHTVSKQAIYRGDIYVSSEGCIHRDLLGQPFFAQKVYAISGSDTAVEIFSSKHGTLPEIETFLNSLEQ